MCRWKHNFWGGKIEEVMKTYGYINGDHVMMIGVGREQ